MDLLMRLPALALLAVLASGCGPMQLAGNWNVMLDRGGTSRCIGTMALVQDGASLGGTFVCTGSKELQGSANGSVRDDNVSLTWSASGFMPILITCLAKNDHDMSGTANGSGLNAANFDAVRQ